MFTIGICVQEGPKLLGPSKLTRERRKFEMREEGREKREEKRENQSWAGGA
jgi:hypothetical protein